MKVKAHSPVPRIRNQAIKFLEITIGFYPLNYSIKGISKLDKHPIMQHLRKGVTFNTYHKRTLTRTILTTLPWILKEEVKTTTICKTT